MPSFSIHFNVAPTDVRIVRTSGRSVGITVGDELSLWFTDLADARSTLQALHAALLLEELAEVTGVAS